MTILPWAKMGFTRNGAAWCPITGKRAGVNEPRIADGLVLEHQADARIYYRFPADQGFTAYAPGSYERPGETTHYALELLEDFTASWLAAGGERLTMGYSYQGREIPAWRLGPVSRPHFLVTNCVHGNEVDGVPGSIEGMRILATHPDFAALRERFTLFFVPICNPDGYHAHTRGVAKLGPNPHGPDQQINLNRVWPWFWQEYLPSSSESKGAAPLDCPEAQALYQWWRFGNGGGPVPIAWAIDQHSTVGDGARYQSRDRCFREYPEGDWFSVWADWIVWRQLRSIQAERVRHDGAPDLWINYFRSRFKPHLHPFWGTRTAEENGGQAPISLVTEHNKVAFVVVEEDQETYQSACDYNLDVLIAAAQVAQGGAVEARSAVLIEHEIGSNQAQNSEWDQWQKSSVAGVPDYRPGYWTGARMRLIEQRGEKHMQHHGAALRTEGSLLLDLPEGYEFQGGRVPAASVPGLGGAFYLVRRLSDGLWVLRQVSTGTVAGSSADVAVLDLGTLQSGTWPLLFAASATVVYVVSWPSLQCVARRLDAATGWLPETILTTSAPVTNVAYLYNAAQDDTVAWWADGNKKYALTLATGAVSAVTGSISNSHLYPVLFRPSSGPHAGQMFRFSSVGAGLNRYVVEWLNDAGTVVDTEAVEVPGGTGWLSMPQLHGAVAWDDANQEARIYGAARGSLPATDAIDGVLYLWFDGVDWQLEIERPFSAEDESQDTHDEDGEYPDFDERLIACGAVLLQAADSPALLAYILGGTDLDSQAYPRRVLVHDWTDGTIGLGLDETYGYLRYNVAFDGASNKRWSTTWSVKADPESISGYTRITNSPGDSVSGTLTQRRVRNYYSLPARWWMRYQGSVVLGRNSRDKAENEWRAYLRVYRDGQGLWLDSPMVQQSTWPSSWSPYGIARLPETATWNSAVHSQWHRVRLTWQPAAVFLAANGPILLARIGPQSGERLELWSTGDSSDASLQREYNLNDVYGTAEPTLELRRYSSGGTYVACSVPVYWGGYVKDVSLERFDTPLTLELWQHPDLGFGLVVRNAGCVGYAHVSALFDPGAGGWGAGAAMDLHLLGGGWWCEPNVRPVRLQELRPLADGQGRLGALLIGDRDPTFGLVNTDAAFRYRETFDRANSSDLGSDWDSMGQSGNGFDIVSGEAKHVSVGSSYERWDARPGIADCELHAKVRIDASGGQVGLMHKLDWSASVLGDLRSYEARLSSLTPTSALLYLFRKDTGTDSNLGQIAVPGFAVGTNYELIVGSNGTTVYAKLLNSVGDVVLANVSATDSTYQRPGAFGIHGHDSITISEVWAAPLIPTRITD